MSFPKKQSSASKPCSKADAVDDARISPANTADEDVRTDLEQTIEKKERRKVRAKREGQQSPWFGLGMFGLVGWSVALPTLFGIALGSWIDRRWSGQISWTLTLLFCGVVIGGINAWYWMHKESR